MITSVDGVARGLYGLGDSEARGEEMAILVLGLHHAANANDLAHP